MVRGLVLIGVLAVVCCIISADVSLSEFSARRAKLRESAKDGVIVLYGRSDKEAEADRNGFFQESNFYYLTGIRDPGEVLVLTASSETLYVAPRDAKIEKWTGRRLAFEDEVSKLTGIESVRPYAQLEADLTKLAPKKIYALPSKTESLKRLLPDAEVVDATRHIALLRMTKSAAELVTMRKAIDATIAAHRISWKTVAPGKYEYQIAAAMTNTYFDRGCERNAYPPIVGSGPNATVLHYFHNSRRMDAGEVVLMDVGAECDGYAADITRTVPVNGKFSSRQRELYDAVLAAERAVIAAAKPGLTVKQLKQIALDSLDSGPTKLGQYLTHGVSHHIGLDVHDAADNDLPLAPGAVITVEPGVYLPQENIGIRIEDMILITENGAKILTAELPVEAAAIEQEMNHRVK